MKKIKSIILLTGFLLAIGCEQEVLTPEDPQPTQEPTPAAGSANFSKYVAIGTSITAGFQAGALFTDGQNESLGAILANQFAGVNSGAAFNQPSIGSVNGYNSTFSNPGAGVIVGRMILFDPDGVETKSSASPTPSARPISPIACTNPVEYTVAVPAPYNTADLPTPFTGNKAALNNFAVPGIIAYQLTQAGTGNPANPLYNGLYARFASNPGTSTILGDAMAAAPTFFSYELGFNEALGYATRGGTGTDLLTPPYDPTTFSSVINGTVGAILGTFPNAKGVIATVPDITKLPHFSLVAWNSIVLPDQATIDATNSAYAPYNAGLDQLVGLGALSSSERDKRKIVFTSGKNGIIILDKTLTDLTGINPALKSMRMATSADKILLAAGAILGTRADCANPSSVYGVGVPLADQYVLLPSELTAIQDAITGYNNAISAIVTANSTRLAKADLYAAYNSWVSAPNATILASGIPVLASITPPLAGFSEDGIHPNGKGTAVFANVFISAINSTFGASLNPANVTKYKGTRTPVNGK